PARPVERAVGAEIQARVDRQARGVAHVGDEELVSLLAEIAGDWDIAPYAEFRDEARTFRPSIQRVRVQRMPLVDVSPERFAVDAIPVSVVRERVRQPAGDAVCAPRLNEELEAARVAVETISVDRRA